MTFTIDKEFETPIYSPTCSTCKHLTDGSERKCAAFPEGIPIEIWKGDNDHRDSFQGDRDIQFELAEGSQNADT